MSTPKDQIRASIAMTHAIAIAERLLQADKSNPSYKLSDLRDDNERGIYVDAAASFLLDQTGRTERAEALNQCRAHGFAVADDPQETLMRDARQDAVTFGDPVVQAFMSTSPRFCAICKEELITNRVDVLITDHLRGQAHGLCCARRDDRYEFVNEFTYKLLEAK